MILPDIPRVYTALAEWLACIIYVLPLRRTIKGGKFVSVSILILIVQLAFLYYTKGLPIGLWLPCMLMAVILMFLFVWKCGNLGLNDAIYTTIRAFGLAELAASLEWQLHCYFWPDGKMLGFGMLLLAGIYAICFGSMAWLEHQYEMRSDRLKVNRREILSALIIGVVVFTISNVSFITTNSSDAGYGFAIFNTRTLVDLGGVAILFAHYVLCCELRYRQKLDAMEWVLQNQHLQYQQSKENMELISQKYHDFKHQIAALRAASSEEQRNAYLNRMEEEIKRYETENKTGNPVLDTILTSKSQRCQQEKIGLTCVVDGTLLEFMDVMDICSIFGNTLDNAIEYEENVNDIEKRLIHLSVSQHIGFILIRCENYCTDMLTFEQGLPRTTKGDGAFHGYGLKSVRQTVEKYDGSLTVEVKDNWFTLKALVPLPKDLIK